MFHLLNFQKNIKKYAGSRSAVPRFFLGIPGACAGTRTLTKVLESAPSDRQTDENYGSS